MQITWTFRFLHQPFRYHSILPNILLIRHTRMGHVIDFQRVFPSALFEYVPNRQRLQLSVSFLNAQGQSLAVRYVFYLAYVTLISMFCGKSCN